MNRALLDPFQALTLPDELELTLVTDGKATCIGFNRHGNVLAVGSSNGSIALWDFDTRRLNNEPVAFVKLADADSQAHVTALAFPSPRIGHTILASFAANESQPDQGPACGVVSSSAGKAPLCRHGLLTSERGTGVLRLYKTLGAASRDGRTEVDPSCPSERVGEIICEIEFDMPIVHFVAHPTKRGVVIVLPASRYPLLVTLAPGRYQVLKKDLFVDHVSPSRVHIFPKASDPSFNDPVAGTARPEHSRSFVTVAVLHQPQTRPAAAPGAAAENDIQAPQVVAAGGRRGARAVLDPFVVTFTHDGKKVLRGGPDGIIHVFQLDRSESIDKKVRRVPSCATLINSFKVQGGAAIRSLTLLKTRLLVNSADRNLRLFHVEELFKPRSPGSDWASHETPVVQTVFKDAIDRSQARCACFSRDGDFVLAGMTSGGGDRIVVWKTSDGQEETVLESPSEGIVDLLWHPRQPVIASVGGRTGKIMVWAKNFTENWSAFAPEFTELDANEEYEESENEFDAKHPQNERTLAAERERLEASNDVDVDAKFCFSSDEEVGDDDSCASDLRPASENDEFFFLPATPIPDTHMPYKTESDSGQSARDLLAKKKEEKEVADSDQRGGRTVGGVTAKGNNQRDMDNAVKVEPSSVMKSDDEAPSAPQSEEVETSDKQQRVRDSSVGAEGRPSKRSRQGNGVSFAPTVDIVEPTVKGRSAEPLDEDVTRKEQGAANVPGEEAGRPPAGQGTAKGAQALPEEEQLVLQNENPQSLTSPAEKLHGDAQQERSDEKPTS